ncbi:beta-ketoacyl synthase N-terminal-like domain-containing protein [Dactylosporangium sp. CS-033363]|uniref:beta-ketoacyl synthase N-terminal-like domain-containing protein n=1 Tax=Dactylosporangium sp. CS-033363 TaxID=3239935 RepID=UPI003D93B6E8
MTTHAASPGPVPAAPDRIPPAAAWRLSVDGAALYLPGAVPAAALEDFLGRPVGDWARQFAEPADPAAVVGRKGLRYAEPATRLALCAVHRALGLPRAARPAPVLSARTAVIGCSDLGNVDVVARVARTVAEEGSRGVSVLDAPNVSSNVLASTVAQWFGFGGPNLMLCSGPDAGSIGLRLAARLLRAGRADRVVLVGAEPSDEVATALHAADGLGRLAAGAACLILRAGAPSGLAVISPVDDGAGAKIVVGPGGFEPAEHWGDHRAARDVVALALAVHLAGEEDTTVLVRRRDGSAGALVGAP